LKQDPALA
jgi:hypothetical protein